MRRLPAALTPILESPTARSGLPLRAVEAVFAPDSTGFSTSRFVRWFDEKYGVGRSGRAWVEAHAMTGVRTSVVTAALVEGPDAGDCPLFRPPVERTAENFAAREVAAGKAYLSRENLELLGRVNGTAYIPSKVNGAPGEAGGVRGRMFHYHQLRREDFLEHYHRRSNAGSTLAMAKAKFRDHVRSRTDVAQALGRSAVGGHVKKQPLRAGTAAGANDEEARGAESRADFVHKVGLAWKECRESVFWPKVVRRAKLVKPSRLGGLLQEVNELSAILAKSRLTAQRGGKGATDEPGPEQPPPGGG